MKEKLIKLYNKTITKVLTALGFSTTFVFMACYGPPPTDYYLEVFPGDLDLDAEGRDTSITVSTRGQWSVSENSPFVSVMPSGGEGTDDVVLTIEPNLDDTVRYAQITITGEDSEMTLTVTQQPKEAQ